MAKVIFVIFFTSTLLLVMLFVGNVLDANAANGLVRNKFCTNIAATVVKVFDVGAPWGYAKIDGTNTLIQVDTDDDNYPLYVGMKLPHKKSWCLAYTHEITMITQKDGGTCYMPRYDVYERYIGPSELEYFQKLSDHFRRIDNSWKKPVCKDVDNLPGHYV